MAERDLIERLLPNLAEFDVYLQGAAYRYVRDAIKRGARIGAADFDIAASFDVDNPKVVDWLREYTIRLAGRVNRTTTDALRDTLAEGLDAGETLRDLRKRVSLVMGDDASRYRAEMIARTEVGRAENAGRVEQLKEAGAVRKVWATNQDACAWCQAMDGTVVGIDENFFSQGDSFDIGTEEKPRVMHLDYSDTPHPPLHPHCVLGNTCLESPGTIVAGLRSWYAGDVIEIEVADGTRLTVTPNHMILTTRGWVVAQCLREGSYVFDCPGLKRPGTCDPDTNDRPTCASQIFDALWESSGSASTSVPVSAEYLHGDARSCHGNIDVVRSDGLLRNTGQTKGSKRLDHQSFGWVGTSTEFAGGSHLAPDFKRLALATDSFMGCSRQSLPFLFAQFGHSDFVRLAAASWLYASFEQASANHIAAGGVSVSQCQLRLAREVARANLLIRQDQTRRAIETPADTMEIVPSAVYGDVAASVAFRDACSTLAGVICPTKIIGVKRHSFVGHVYDLQTDTTLYSANGILSSNCRCIVQLEFEGE